MKIKKFNENITKKDSPFTNWEMMEELIAPIFKYKFDIYYRFYTMYDEDVMPRPIGPKHNKNFTDKKFWAKNFNVEENGYSAGSTNKPGTTQMLIPSIFYGTIIDINDQIFNELSADEQRGGRPFSTYDSEKLIQILEDIERIKDDCTTEGYTLSMFINNNGFRHWSTNFNGDAQISLLILDGVFK